MLYKAVKNTKIHYAWFVLIGVCLLQCASLGILSGSNSVFFPYAAADLGFSQTKFAYTVPIANILSCITMPYVPRLYEKKNLKVVLTIAALCYSFAVLISSTYTKVYQWYISAIISGLSGSFLLFLPASILINNWFDKNNGLALSIASFVSSGCSLLMSLFTNRYILLHGWRQCYIINGSLCLAMSMTAILFFLHYSPESLGIHPYGYQGEKKAVSKEYHFKADRSFFTMLILYSAIYSVVSFQQYSSQLGTISGFDEHSAGLMVTAPLVGAMICKSTFGVLADKIGIRKTAILAAALMTGGVILAMTGQRTMLYIGMGLAGSSTAANLVISPLLARDIFKKDYGENYSRTMSFGMIYSAALALIYSFVIDTTKSFFGIEIFLLGVMTVFVYTVLTSIRNTRMPVK